MKRCRLCGETKPYSDFAKDRSASDGYEGRCRACLKAKYLARTAERQKLVDADIVFTCRECKITKHVSDYYVSNHTRCISCVSRYRMEYQNRPEVVASRATDEYRAKSAKYRAENPDKRRATVGKYQQKEEVKKTRAERQRARQKGLPTLPPDAYSFIIKMYGVCLKCGSDQLLQIDHVVPLARGGEHSLRNLQVLCRSCNTSKGARSEDDYRAFVVIATPQELGVNQNR